MIDLMFLPRIIHCEASRGWRERKHRFKINSVTSERKERKFYGSPLEIEINDMRV